MSAIGLARKAHKYYTSEKWGIARLLKHLNRVIYCCDIAYQVNIPETTLLPHQGMGVVMHPRTVIGNNCIIFQHTTFGASHGDGESDAAPILGDSVMVGAGSILLGAIRIGNNVTIGAHSVVINDVPDNAVVAGIPAVIKKYKSIEEKKQ